MVTYFSFKNVVNKNVKVRVVKLCV